MFSHLYFMSIFMCYNEDVLLIVDGNWTSDDNIVNGTIHKLVIEPPSDIIQSDGIISKLEG